MDVYRKFRIGTLVVSMSLLFGFVFCSIYVMRLLKVCSCILLLNL